MKIGGPPGDPKVAEPLIPTLCGVVMFMRPRRVWKWQASGSEASGSCAM